MVHVRFNFQLLVLAGTAYLCLTVDSVKSTSDRHTSEKIIEVLPIKETIAPAKVESSVSNAIRSTGVLIPVSTEKVGRNAVGSTRLSKTPTESAFAPVESTTNGLPTTEESKEITTGKIGSSLGSACTTNQQCSTNTANSECEASLFTSRKTCQCAENYEKSGNTCKFMGLPLGSKCTTSKECILRRTNSECKIGALGKKTCECLPAFDQEIGRCVARQTHLGGNCSTNEECTKGTPNSGCISELDGSSTCQCLPTHQEIWGKMCQLPGPELGETCKTNEECSAKTPNSTCKFFSDFYSSCECLPTHEQKLLTCNLRDPGSSLGSACTTNQQCSTNTAYSECKASAFSGNKICQCTENYEKSGNTCTFMGLGLGSRCSTNTQCSAKVSKSECKYDKNYYYSTCQCLVGYEEYYSACKFIGMRLGETCTTDQECTKKTFNSECKRHYPTYTCQCSSGFEQSLSLCIYERIKLGSQCSSDWQCQNAISNSVCDQIYIGGDFTCQCASNYYSSSSICVRYSDYRSRSPGAGLIVVIVLACIIVFVVSIVICCYKYKRVSTRTSGAGHVIRPPPQNIWSMPPQQNFVAMPPPAGNMPARTPDMPPCYDQVIKPGVQNYAVYPPPQYNFNSQVPPPFVNPSNGASGTPTVADSQRLVTQPGGTTPYPAAGYSNQAFNNS